VATWIDCVVLIAQPLAAFFIIKPKEQSSIFKVEKFESQELFCELETNPGTSVPA
jgi:hypothetical protein